MYRRQNCSEWPNRPKGTDKCHRLESVTVLATVESPNMLFQPPKSRAFVCRWRLWEGEKAEIRVCSAQPDVMIDEPVLVQSAAF